MAAQNIRELARRVIGVAAVQTVLTEDQVIGEIQDYIAHKSMLYGAYLKNHNLPHIGDADSILLAFFKWALMEGPK